jgi:hypothetical protein
MGGASAWGIRSLADTYFRYFQPGLACALRLQVVDTSTVDYGRLGFVPSVTGAQPGQSGVVDIPIQPPADVQEVSMHNIGQSGGRLQFGARTFLVSHTFVLQQMQDRDLQDPYLVWRDPLVMGLYYNQRLFSIESITHEDVGSEVTLWKLVCNAMEFPSSPSS